jgi:hypothetical protein
LSPVSLIGDDARRKRAMNVIDRFTRDRVSRLVWGVLALACLAMFLVGVQGEQRAYTRQLDATTARSEAYSANVIAPVVHVKDGVPVFYYREAYTKIQAEVIAVDPTVGRVRVWGTDGLLLFSTDNRQRTGTIEAPNDPGVQAASMGGTYRSLVTQTFTWATTGVPGEDTQLLQTYSPLRLATQIQPAGAVQVDYFVDALHAAARGQWPTIRWIFGVLFAICLVMTLLSLIRSRRAEPEVAVAGEELGAGAAVVSPAPSEVVTDRESSLRDELAASREQLVQAEEAYRFLETKLKVARSELADREAMAPDAVDARVAELQEALKRSEAELMLLRATGARPAQTSMFEPETTESGAPQAGAPEATAPEATVPEAPAAAAAPETEASEPVQRPEPVVAASVLNPQSAMKMAALAEELEAVRNELAAAQDDIRAAQHEAEEARSSPNPPPSNALSDLEARVSEAERRAEEAEHHLEEAALTPEANALRQRLARTAARKKLGSDDPRAQ